MAGGEDAGYLLEVKNLMVFYENSLALNNVSLKCARGRITGIFGANSAGKSTLMYAISGIILDLLRREIRDDERRRQEKGGNG